MTENTVVIGAQWGDEGKGKVVDLLTEDANVIVRFQGGNNAGHTLVVGSRKLILHLIPSGILHEDKKCLIGNGVVLDPEVFCAEVDTLNELGISAGPERLKVSYKTQLIMPYHKRLDTLREEKKTGADKIGTTGRGIGPAYEDKAARIGIRAADVADPELMRQKIAKALPEKNALFEHLFQVPPLSPGEVFETIRPFARRLVPYLADVSTEIDQEVKNGGKVLFEGAQGTHLDLDHGTYPFVTSSNTVAGNAPAGSGCGPGIPERILAVVKAYTTRVGAGPFPTELKDETGDYLQGKGTEFGATTGRKRRCGWLDLVLLGESVRLNTPTGIALTKLDVLSGLPELKLCVAYKYEGRQVLYPPQKENGLAGVEPVYQSLPGWEEDISGVRSWDLLPAAARNYIERLEDILGVRVTMVSVGPDREQTLFR
ncbi:MAG: adenylosuccinate synthase [Desulfohalobiaceae bacterium]|nr:adenylosuccinate synthase [Desulfohalobiaceae bacterium]